MAEMKLIFNTLKKSLKAHGYNYSDVATHLGVTEASVKRFFSEHKLSIERLEQVCQMMELEISDLIRQMNEQQPRLQQLSEAQESIITNDPDLLLVGVCVLNRWNLEEITSYYKLSKTDCIQKLTQLDRLKIIELLPNNKIKLLVAPNFSWIDKGPIETFFRKTIGQEYFKSKFEGTDELLIVLNGMLSSKSTGEFHKKLKRIAQEFELINHDDAALPTDKKNGVTAVLSIRNWQYGYFKHMVRD